MLGSLLASESIDRDVDAAVHHVMSGLGELVLHPDVAEGLRLLADGGVRLVTLTNGSTSLAQDMFTTAGVADCFERLLSVETRERGNRLVLRTATQHKSAASRFRPC